MTPERGQRVYAVFEAALKCDPAGRMALFEELCAGDPELRDEVERLLARDAEAERDRFLANAASTERDALPLETSTERNDCYWAQSPDGTSPETPISPATVPAVLDQHPDYVVKRELGRGGMGHVFLAENRLSGRQEVLKVMGREIMERPGVLERFLREIRAVATLRHPNIVTAYHAARLGDSFVLAMEYADGLDLSRMVKAHGPLPVPDACNYVRQTALGLQHAHEHAMVHRDIKPSNLMLARQGDRDVVKMLDFGLAKVKSEGPTDWSLTYEGQMLGTPDFIAPEQIIDARQADIRADIYGLGATLYYLLTGGPPFQGTSLYDILHAHQSTDATPLNVARADVPVELAALVAKMMAKEPERRFQAPAEVALALAPFLQSGAYPGLASSPEISSVGQAALSLQTADGQSAPALLATLGAALTSETRAPSKPNGPSTSALLHRRTWIRASAETGVLLLALVIASVLIFRTKNGTIVFENLPEESVVTADGDTFNVDWPDGKGKGHAQISMPAGKHSVEVKVNGVQVTGEKVSVASGGVTPFVVRFDPRRGFPEAPVLNTTPSDSPPNRVKNSIGITLVLIPPGQFEMGSRHEPPAEDERPRHLVRISHAFYLGAFEVTQEQYETIMEKNPSHFSGRPKNPVEDVTWIDAIIFCNKLSQRDMLPPYYRIVALTDVTILGGSGYRLPTEAEWEYSCRAGNPENVPFLDDSDLGRFAWMAHNCHRMTHPVGEKEPNSFGLYDMYGNVWEWCWDQLGAYPESLLIDPMGPATGKNRVLHGNAWWNGTYKATRPSFRLAFSPEKTSPNHDFGFRVAAGGADGLPIIAVKSPAASAADKPPVPPTVPRERKP